MSMDVTQHLQVSQLPREKKRIDEGPINEALINDLTIQAFAQMSINLSGLPMAARKNTKTSALRP